MKIDLTKQQTLKFKVKIEGSKKVPSVRLNIKLKNTSLLREGTMLAGVASVQIPNLDGFSELIDDNTKATLEVIVDSQFYTPWSDSILVERAVKVESALIEEEIVEEGVSITVDVVEDVKPKRKYIEF